MEGFSTYREFRFLAIRVLRQNGLHIRPQRPSNMDPVPL
jgi:hypothetical protein